MADSGFTPLLDQDGSAPQDTSVGIKTTDEVPPEEGLSDSEVDRRRRIHGYNELAEKKRSPILEFLANFWGPMPIMIWIAIIIELIPKPDDTGQLEPSWADFGVLLFLQLVNGFVSWHEHQKAADAIAALKNSLSPKTHVKRNGEWLHLDARLLVPGDRVSLAIGGRVPADCEVLGPREIYCDQAALTGESLPVKIDIGDMAKMGSQVTTGECDAVVRATGDGTFFGRTAKLIAGVNETGHFEKVLYKITAVLLGVSLVLTGIILGYLLINSINVLEALAICVVLLVASIPIAMNVVCTSTMAIGSRKLAAKKAVVTRLASIEELAGMDMLCSDKTGTLTLGRMQMQDILVYRSGMAEREVLLNAALAAKWFEKAKDAIDRLVLGDAHDKHNLTDELNTYTQTEYLPFDPKIKRTESTLQKDGSVFQTTKGAPQVILAMCTSCPLDVRATIDAKIDELAERGIRSLGIAKRVEGDEEGWCFLGILTFIDPPRHDTRDTIEKANALGIDVKMITGDQIAIARETCYQLGMGTNIQGTHNIPGGDDTSAAAVRFKELIVEANGFAEVFPEHKFKIVETFRDLGYRTGMTGDGVNDAPALKRADIGIAVEGATDAARAAADIVLMEEGLGVIIDAIFISRKIFNRMRNYVTYRIACTLQLLLFFFVAVLTVAPNQYDICSSTPAGSCKNTTINILPPEPKTCNGYQDVNVFCRCPDGAKGYSIPGEPCNPPYFKMPVIALVLITILNDGTIITIAYDNVVPKSTPAKWNLVRVCLTALLLGVVACGSSLMLLFMAMRSGNADSDPLKDAFGLGTLSLKQISALMYLKISLSDFMTVFTARTSSFFFTERPGTALMCAFVGATGLSSIFASAWFTNSMQGIPSDYVGFVWGYCIFWFIIQDLAKVGLNMILDRVFYSEDVEKQMVADVQRKNRVMFEDQHRRKGAKKGMRRANHTSFSSDGALAPLRLTGSPQDMGQVLSRIELLTSELQKLKAVVQGMGGANSGSLHNSGVLAVSSRTLDIQSRARSESAASHKVNFNVAAGKSDSLI